MRHGLQRSNRVRLKADCHAMLAKLGSEGLTLGEINEMMVRLKPPTGAAAPIELTDYTSQDNKRKGRAPSYTPPHWEMSVVVGIPGIKLRHEP